MSELTVLQAMRLKGRLSPEAAAACTGRPVGEVRAEIDALVASGLATAAGTSARITPEGRTRLGALLDEERGGIDQAGLTTAYDDFDEINSDLKSVVTAWQLLDADTPNDHTDAAYDASVVARLTALHDRFEPLLGRMTGLAPRLSPYRTRFRAAVDKVRNGDHAFVARPVADSYHTVWFEFHEELIGLLGRTRAEEAAAGRAV